MRLLWLEFKRMFCSLAFVIYSVLVCAFVVINVNPMVDRSLAHMPTPAHYDAIYVTDFHSLKSGVLEQLTAEYKENSYTAYPFGFAKSTALNATKRVAMRQQIKTLRQAQNRQSFNTSLKQVNHLLGGHSEYTPANVITLARRQMTTLEAKQDYHLTLKRDRISGTFARLFADIADLIVGILPTVIVIAFCDAGRRSRAATTIQSKLTSPGKRLLTQYSATLMVLLLPVLAVGLYFTLRVMSLYPHQSLDLFAFMKAAFIWVLPTLMVSSALGFLTYQIFGNYLGFAVQMIWWLVTMMIGARRVDGYYGWLLIPRHNSLHNVVYFYDHLNSLLVNRLVYVGVALIMVGVAVLIAQMRKGAHHFATSSHN